jgi:high frequency lysogenization protein
MSIISPPDRDLTLALAGLFQASALVHQVARLDQFDQQAMYESSYSLIRLDAASIEEVYGSEIGVELGLRTMIQLFSGQADDATREVYTYAVAMHQLGLKLAKFQKTSDVIRGELEQMQERFINMQDPESDLDTLHEALADLYTRTISHLTPRIIVQGDPEKLQQSSSVNRIRAALFSGIRSAFLWHQLGGRRWKLVIGRKDYVNMARRILNG